MTLDLLVNIEQNMFTIESIICIITFMAGIILYSRDYKIGVVTNFLIFSSIFILFYVWGLNFRIPLVIALAHLVLMSLSLFMVEKSSRSFV